MLQGKYIKLRALEEEDLITLKNWRNSAHVRKTTREYKLLNMLNQKKWFESIHAENPPKHIMFGVINKQNQLVGVTGLTYIDWKNRHAEISIYMGEENWQVSKEAKDIVDLIMDYGFGELNLNRLWVEIFGNAKENIKFIELLKFTKEGTLRQKVWRNGTWYDSHIYSRLSHEHRK
jgi:RimJ/RimL family protein N-acetyltransferase